MLEPVEIGDPHVVAHNAEREAINEKLDRIQNFEDSPTPPNFLTAVIRDYMDGENPVFEHYASISAYGGFRAGPLNRDTNVALMEADGAGFRVRRISEETDLPIGEVLFNVDSYAATTDFVGSLKLNGTSLLSANQHLEPNLDSGIALFFSLMDGENELGSITMGNDGTIGFANAINWLEFTDQALTVSGGFEGSTVFELQMADDLETPKANLYGEFSVYSADGATNFFGVTDGGDVLIQGVNLMAFLSYGFAQDVDLHAPSDYFRKFTILDDGSSTDNWPNRMEWWYDPAGGDAPRRTGFFNEYGEFRVAPAKSSTVAMRIFQRENNTGPAHSSTVNLFEVMDNRQDRNILMGIKTDGTVVAPNIGQKVVTWPTGSEPSLSGVPDGTLWVEYTP